MDTADGIALSLCQSHLPHGRIPEVRSAISNFDQVSYPEKLSAPSRPLDLQRASVQRSAAVSNKNGLGFQPMSWEQVGAWDGPSIRE